MAAAAPRSIRPPAVAGTFYPAEPDRCGALARSYLTVSDDALRVPGMLCRGAIVPHAGWICSGAIAGESIGTLAASWNAVGRSPDVVVVFGAIHTPIPTDRAVLSEHGAWREPGGDAPVAVGVADVLGENGGLFTVDERFHRREHAVEVELPIVQSAWPEASILPIEVPAQEQAIEIGEATAEQIRQAGKSAVYLASSDLTHYGPAYRFAPAGVGTQGLAWAKENDRRLLDLVAAMHVEQVVPEARERLNACGAGAIAAMLAACRAAGATQGRLLRHASSLETLAAVAPQPATDAVGYAAVIVG